MKILIFGYREWARSIYRKLHEWYGDEVVLANPDDCNVDYVKAESPDIIFFIGWSWKVSENIIYYCPCLCLHPSPLPRYRGGSPIQNQVINGEVMSAVTIFKMNDTVDAGDIIRQEPISLDGYLCDILNRIVDVGAKLIHLVITDYLWDYVSGSPQSNVAATYYPRRKPYESELFDVDFSNKTAKQIYDMVRCLQPPYPEVFIKCREGKLILERVRYEL